MAEELRGCVVVRSAKIARKSAKSAPKNVNKAELNFFFEEKRFHPLTSKAKWYYCSLSQVQPLFGTPSPSCQLEGSVKRNQTSQKSSQIYQRRNGLQKVRILTLRNFLAWETFFRIRRTCMAGLFYVFGCEKFCKHIMGGLFGFFLPITIL